MRLLIRLLRERKIKHLPKSISVKEA